MSDPVVERMREQIRFPGRLRVFAEDGFDLGALGLGDGERDWPHAPAPVLLAASCGAAWAERVRGGRVIVIVRGDALRDGLSLEALDLAAKLTVDLTAVIVGDCDQKILTAHGWRVGEEAEKGPRAVLRSVPMRSGVQVFEPLRREWTPVHVGAVPALGDLGAIDGFFTGRPDLCALHREWKSAADTQAKLIAGAQLAAEGLRVVWHISDAVDLMPWILALREIGERGLGIKLLCSAARFPPLCLWNALPGWWACGPRDGGELAAVMRQTLETEDPMVITLAETGSGSGDYHVPGSGRWLAPRQHANVVCDQKTWRTAIEASEALKACGIAIGVFHCLSLVPLPIHDVQQAAQSGPLVIVDSDESGKGLGGALSPHVRESLHRISCLGGSPQRPPDAGEIAQAVREALGE